MSYLPVMNRMGEMASRAFPRPVAGLVIVDGLGRVAMAYQEYANQGWCFPKGGLDHREPSADAPAMKSPTWILRAIPSAKGLMT